MDVYVPTFYYIQTLVPPFVVFPGIKRHFDSSRIAI